jgi:NAD(P)-dependent dehydrogenase (short-subunit alcohol dehydrogenase family)
MNAPMAAPGHDVALVTGASRGLGRAIALELATRGYSVIAGVRDVASATASFEAATASLAGSVQIQSLDVTNLGDWKPPAQLGLLVNNAGFRGQYLAVEDLPLDEWRRTFETNLFGAVALTQRVIPGLRAGGGGIICNIGSLGAYSPMPFYSAYRASKMALAVLSESLRIELAPFGIRVVDIPIGGVDTDMLRDGIARRPAEAINFPAYRPMAERQAAASRAWQGGIASPADVARRVVDAMMHDVPPLRRPCDPNAERAFAAGVGAAEEGRLAAALTAFT